MSTPASGAPDAQPLLSFSAGTPTDEELVAVLVALSGLSGDDEPAPLAPSSGWVDRARAIGAPLHPGPGAWVASARW